MAWRQPSCSPQGAVLAASRTEQLQQQAGTHANGVPCAVDAALRVDGAAADVSGPCRVAGFAGSERNIAVAGGDLQGGCEAGAVLCMQTTSPHSSFGQCTQLQGLAGNRWFTPISSGQILQVSKKQVTTSGLPP